MVWLLSKNTNKSNFYFGCRNILRKQCIQEELRAGTKPWHALIE